MPVAIRAGKKFSLDISWSEDEEGYPHRHIRPRYDWRVPETAVIQQTEGQAFWIHHGRAQQVHTAMVPITAEQVREGWNEIQRLEELQRSLLEVEERRRQAQQQQQPPTPPAEDTTQQAPAAPSSQPPKKKPGTPKKKRSPGSAPPQPSTPPAEDTPVSPPATSPPAPDPDDDEPDRL